MHDNMFMHVLDRFDDPVQTFCQTPFSSSACLELNPYVLFVIIASFQSLMGVQSPHTISHDCKSMYHEISRLELIAPIKIVGNIHTSTQKAT